MFLKILRLGVMAVLKVGISHHHHRRRRHHHHHQQQQHHQHHLNIRHLHHLNSLSYEDQATVTLAIRLSAIVIM